MGYPSITGEQYLNARSPKQTVTMFNTRHIKKEKLIHRIQEITTKVS
jgi:hypothetical protein